MPGGRVVERLRRSAVSLAADATVGEVARTMEASGVGAVVIVEDGRPVGIVTDRDLVRRVLAPGLPFDARADGVMTSPVVTIDADRDVRDAHEAIRQASVRRLVVVDDGVLVGMLTLDDLLVELTAELHALGRAVAVELHHPGRDAGGLVAVPGS